MKFKKDNKFWQILWAISLIVFLATFFYIDAWHWWFFWVAFLYFALGAYVAFRREFFGENI